MEQKIGELRNSMEDERTKIYSTVKEKLASLHSNVVLCKERISVLEDIEKKQQNRIEYLELDNRDLTHENDELKKTLVRFTEGLSAEISDEEEIDGASSSPQAEDSPPLSPQPLRDVSGLPLRPQSERIVPVKIIRSSARYESVCIDDTTQGE